MLLEVCLIDDTKETMDRLYRLAPVEIKNDKK
jgi:hypothetical protein